MAQLGLLGGPAAPVGQPPIAEPPAAVAPPAVRSGAVTTASSAGTARPRPAGDPAETVDSFAQTLASQATSAAVPAAGQASSPTAAVASSSTPVSQPGPAPLAAIKAAAVPDPRWTEILGLASASLAAGARGAATPSAPIPAYTGTLSAEVEARRRGDGSLNPNDLPSTEALSETDLQLARLANSVPNAVLALGQNEGVTAPGATQSVNDSYDLLAWVAQLQAMATGSAPPFVQENGYVWTTEDVLRNLKVALDGVRQNKEMYNTRWEARWQMLRTAGLGDIADQEQASVTLVDPAGAPGVA